MQNHTYLVYNTYEGMGNMELKKCLLYDDRSCNECGECTRCDLNPDKLCDNCMKCLNSTDADYTSIEIDEVYETTDIPDEE